MSGPGPARGAAEQAVAAWVGRRTRIRPVTPGDYGWLFDAAVGTPAGSHWRLHGDVPHYDQFVNGLLAGSVALFVIEDLDGRALGMVQLWGVDQRARHGQLTAFLVPEAEGRSWPLEGITQFVGYAFTAFDLRKLYLEVLEPELERFRSLVGGVLREEGVLQGHRYVLGQLVDCHVLALYREDFDRIVERLAGPVAVPAS